MEGVVCLDVGVDSKGVVGEELEAVVFRGGYTLVDGDCMSGDVGVVYAGDVGVGAVD